MDWSPLENDSARHTDVGLAHGLRSYLLPVLLVGTISAGQFLAPQAITTEMSLLLLALAVLISARIAGVGPGLCAAVLSIAFELLFPGSAVPPVIFCLPDW